MSNLFGAGLGGFGDRVRAALNAILDGNIIRFRGADGTNLFSIDLANGRISLFAATPTAQPAAYTQTYSAASRVHSNPTASTLTHSAVAGTLSGTLIDVTDSYSRIAIERNFKELASTVNELIDDMAVVKTVLNGLIDDLQSLGGVQ